MKRSLLPLTVLLGSCSTRGAAPSPSPGSGQLEQRETYVEAAGGVKLFARSVGVKPDTVIVLHGGPGLTMEYLAEDLTPLAEQHTLIFYDQRGAGRSTLVTDSAALDGERFADDLEAVRRHFRLDRVTLLGHSWGAGVAALYASRFPDRIERLLIVDGIPLQRQGLVDAFEKLAAGRDSVTRREMDRLMEARRADPGDTRVCHAYYELWFEPFFVDPSDMKRSKGDMCAGTPESRRNKIASIDRYVAASLGQWDWRPVVGRVKAPALIIHGSADPLPVESGREWAAAIPGARFLLLQGVGHFPYIEAPERFFGAVHTFLGGSWPDGVEGVRTP